jgi:hypothetical protein
MYFDTVECGLVPVIPIRWAEKQRLFDFGQRDVVCRVLEDSGAYHAGHEISTTFRWLVYEVKRRPGLYNTYCASVSLADVEAIIGRAPSRGEHDS